jgi:hypothetical protein
LRDSWKMKTPTDRATDACRGFSEMTYHLLSHLRQTNSGPRRLFLGGTVAPPIVGRQIGSKPTRS